MQDWAIFSASSICFFTHAIPLTLPWNIKHTRISRLWPAPRLTALPKTRVRINVLGREIRIPKYDDIYFWAHVQQQCLFWIGRQWRRCNGNQFKISNEFRWSFSNAWQLQVFFEENNADNKVLRSVTSFTKKVEKMRIESKGLIIWDFYGLKFQLGIPSWLKIAFIWKISTRFEI